MMMTPGQAIMVMAKCSLLTLYSPSSHHITLKLSLLYSFAHFSAKLVRPVGMKLFRCCYDDMFCMCIYVCKEMIGLS